MSRLNPLWIISLIIPLFFVPAALAADGPAARPWLGLHVMVSGAADLNRIDKQMPAIARSGVNAIILQIDWNFAFKSHPEVASPGAVQVADARHFAQTCKALGVRVIPSIDCLGHQSWAKWTGRLLTAHPELDETRGKYPGNKGIYCRSWCPSDPRVNQIVFPMIDEMIDAFHADAFHVGMDEIFIIGDPDCPRCKGKNPADLFAMQVNSLHEHLVKERKVEMMMWGDRLLDAKALGYSKWEASSNGTAPAIDLIPKDIVICDWHYEKQAQYKSIPFLLKKGFRVWPSGWKNPAAASALLDYSRAHANQRLVGYLSTTWGATPIDKLATFPPTLLAAKALGLAR